MKVKVTESSPTLCDPLDYTVHGILQARILEWVAFPFSRRSSQPRDRTQVSHIAGGFFTSWATRESQERPSLFSLYNTLCSSSLKHNKNLHFYKFKFSIFKAFDILKIMLYWARLFIKFLEKTPLMKSAEWSFFYPYVHHGESFFHVFQKDLAPRQMFFLSLCKGNIKLSVPCQSDQVELRC